MATADTVDVPRLSETSEMSLKRSAEHSETIPRQVNPKKQATLGKRITMLSDRMRSNANWFPTHKGSTWNNVTRPGKSQRTLFVLTASDGSQQFCTVGRVFSATLSEEALSVPTPYTDPNSEHTDLSLHLSLRDSDSENWPGLSDDIKGCQEALCAAKHSAVHDAMVPLMLGSDDKVAGVPGKKLSSYRSKKPKALGETLEESWGGTGMNESGDIMRCRRRCYNETNLSDYTTFMSKWLNVTDLEGESLNYINDSSAVERGDLVLMWFRVLAQATAGNFHMSLEPRSVMVLEKSSHGTGRDGSAAFASALMKAMERDSEGSI